MGEESPSSATRVLGCVAHDREGTTVGMYTDPEYVPASTKIVAASVELPSDVIAAAIVLN